MPPKPIAFGSEEFVSKFWSRVDKSGDCWLWTAGSASTDPKLQYGKIGVGKKRQYAHRVSWILAYGDPGSLHVLHKCDNPKCVRPDHLFLGTHVDNMKDRDQKGRTPLKKGTANLMAKYTDEQIAAVRSDTGSYASIARRHGMSPSHVRETILGNYR